MGPRLWWCDAARATVLALVMAGAISTASLAQSQATQGQPKPVAGKLEQHVQTLTGDAVDLLDDNGKIVGSRGGSRTKRSTLSQQSLVTAIAAEPMARDTAIKLWDFLSDDDNFGVVTLPVVAALVRASGNPESREALWGGLAELQREHDKAAGGADRDRTLLGFFERHRKHLLPLFSEIAETESAGEEMLVLMQGSKVFGADLAESLAWVGASNPAALARRIERERGLGQPVPWEDAAFEHMLRWKRERMTHGAPRAPRSLQGWDRVGEAFVIIFNGLHPLDDSYRKRMLEGIGPIEAFNAVVGGEFELYRMGTSSYRQFLHGTVMKGIREAGSLEAFLARVPSTWSGTGTDEIALQRGMVLLRIASSFGTLDEVLSTVGDLDVFIDNAIHSLGDATHFERNGLVVLDLLTSTQSSAAARRFRGELLDTLYETYRTEPVEALRRIYGGLLSVYQTVTGDRRDSALDRDFRVDEGVFHVPFARLFTAEPAGGHIHRMFMRLDRDTDAGATYASFRLFDRARNATHRPGRHHDVYLFFSGGRTIEIYLNRPTQQGVTQGIADIAAQLAGRRVETVIGRGHSGIIRPFKESSKRVLGSRIGEVSLVLVGTCGGDTAIRELIDTFGYVSFYSTRSTGRRVINEAIMDTYVNALYALPPGGRLSLADVLDRSTSRFLKSKTDQGLRDDASFYALSAKRVLLAQMFDAHVRQLVKTVQAQSR